MLPLVFLLGSALASFTNTTVSRSITLNTTTDKLTTLFQDYQHWQEWDPDLNYAVLNDPSAGIIKGAQGTLVMKTQGNYSFIVSSLENGVFAYDVSFTGALTHWYWDYSTLNGDQIVLEMGLNLSGLLASFYSWLIGKKSTDAFETALAIIKSKVESPFLFIQ